MSSKITVPLDAFLEGSIRPAMHCAWEEIGQEVEITYANTGRKLTNYAAIEWCIYDGGLLTNGRDKVAADLIATALEEHGPNKVMEFLTAHFRFV